MTLDEMIARVAQDAAIEKGRAKAAVRAVFNALQDAMAKGESVRTALGTFSVVQRGERAGRNLRTGEALRIPPSKTVRFKASKAARDRVNGIARPGAKKRAGSKAKGGAKAKAKPRGR